MGCGVGAVLALGCVLCAAGCSAQLVGNYPIVEAVLGGTARLPCDIPPPADNDSFTLVIWFKEEATPIYSYDVRGKLQLPSPHWQERRVLGDRASFDAPSPAATPWAPGVAALTLRDVQRRDDALYRCRVDFRRSPSRNFRVHLAVIVPPDVPRIITDEGEEVTSVAGPYFEGATITLTCVVSGGRPMPTVRWWRGERLLAVKEPPVPEEDPEGEEAVGAADPLEEMLEEEEEEEEAEPMSSRLELGPLSRADLGARLTCQASNTRAAPPVAATVSLDLILAPLEARVLSSEQELSAGRRCSFICQAVGSRPPATITWWLDGLLLPNVSVSQQVSEDGNVTTSTVTLTPTAADHNRVLTCRAENPRMNAAVQEDLWRLNVNFPPSVELQLGTKLNADDIKEGDDVYFECNIEANPNIYKLVWKLNGQVLVDGTRTSVRVINHSLVLRRVDRRRDAGNYTCVASNVEGDGISNTFHLKIKYSPVCAPDQQAALAVPAHDVARVECRVEAHPPPLFFRWFFNSSAAAEAAAADAVAPSVSLAGGGAASSMFESGEFPHLPAVPEERYRMRDASGTTSLLTYTPLTGSDYGDLLCYAVNVVGSQSEPCVFTILPASKPDPPSNCTLVNQTSTSLQLECLEGFDGGQPQTFELVVEDAVTGRRLANLSSRWPAFGVAGLPAGQELSLTVTAVNSRGRSAPVALDAFTLKAAELRTGRRSSLELTPVLAALLALVLLLLLLAVLSAACAVYLRVQRSRDRAAARPKDLAVKDKRLLDKDDKNPDVVPSASVDGQAASVAETPVQPQPQTSPPPQEPPPLPPPNPTSPQGIRNGDLFLKYNNDTRTRACAWDSPAPPSRMVRPASADVTYAELSLPRSASSGGPDPSAGVSGSALRSRRREPPTVYAQIDHSQRAALAAAAAAAPVPSSTPPPPPPPPREIVTVRTPLVGSPQESCV